jgi:hypothetical protein
LSIRQKIVNAIRPSGYAVAVGLKPSKQSTGEAPRISFKSQIQAYRKDVALRDFIDVLSMQSVGMGFYTSCASSKDYQDAEKAKQIVDEFNERNDYDGQLQVLTRELIGTGNAVLQLFQPDKLERVRRVPIVSFDRIFTNEFLELEADEFTQTRNIQVGLKQSTEFGGKTISPDRLWHFRWNPIDDTGWGCGLIQALMEEYEWQDYDTGLSKYVTRTRPSLLNIKAKLDADLIEIFEKFAGPVEAWVADSEKLAKQVEKALKATPKYGGRLVIAGSKKDGNALEIKTPPLGGDARGRFEGIVDYLWNQFCLGGQTPLPKLFTTPGFTEASANAAIEIADRLIMPIQRLVKRDTERLWRKVIVSADSKLDPVKAAVRLNWGSQETPAILATDLIAAAEKGLISKEDFVKNAIKVLHWELTEPQSQQASTADGLAGGVKQK